MIDKKRERRIGQIIMACKIIQFENMDTSTIPKVTIRDIQNWLDVDEKYVSELVHICSCFDRRNIAEDVLNAACIGFGNQELREFFIRGFIHLVEPYFDSLLGKCEMGEVDVQIAAVFADKNRFDITEDLINDLIRKYAKEIVYRINQIWSIQDVDLDAIFEIAQMSNVSMEEFLTLRKELLNY